MPDPHFRQQIRNVVLDRLLGQKEIRSDFAIRLSSCDLFEDGPLSVGQPSKQRIIRSVFSVSGGGVPERGLASGHTPDVVDQIEVMHSLQDKARDTLSSGCLESSLVGKPSENENPRPGGICSHAPADVDPGAIRKVEVNHHDVRLVDFGPTNRLRHACSLGHNAEVGLSFDERAQTMTHKLVIIDQHHSNW
jgi:hypothetical protein